MSASIGTSNPTCRFKNFKIRLLLIMVASSLLIFLMNMFSQYPITWTVSDWFSCVVCLIVYVSVFSPWMYFESSLKFVGMWKVCVLMIIKGWVTVLGRKSEWALMGNIHGSKMTPTLIIKRKVVLNLIKLTKINW